MEKKSYIVSMDPASSTITIAVGAADDDGKLLIEGITSRPMRGITRGEIDNRQLTTEAVREAIDEVEAKFGIRISDVYLGTSGNHIRCADHHYHVFVGEHSDGEILQEDVATLHHGMNNVSAEDGQRIMDRIPGQYIIDDREKVSDPVGRFGKKLDATYNFILGSSMLLDRLEKTLSAMNVRARKTIANAVASAEAVLVPEEKEMGTAVVDLGAGTTDLCIWADGAVRFVRSIPFGADNINRDIKQQGILEKNVEGLKTTFGRAMASQVTEDKLIGMKARTPREKQEISLKNLAIIIEHRLREIIDYVTTEIGDSGYAGRLRGGIVLTGGGSQLAGIDELFREATGMDVRLALPDARVADSSLSKAQDPAHAAAIGLLLKALDDKAEGVPKLPDDDRLRPVPPVPPVETVSPEPPEPPKKPKKDKREKKEGNPLSNWLNSFLSEPLDGDEDF